MTALPRPAQPVCDGEVEALLLLLQRAGGQHVRERTPEHDLRFGGAELRPHRHGGDRLDEAVVEERHPHLQAVRAARDVDLLEDVVGEVRVYLDLEHLGERIFRPRGSRHVVNMAVRRGLAHLGCQLGG
jgi:hypothetical protein